MIRKNLLNGEYTEINNIIALARADEEIEQILLTELIHNFGDKLGETKYNNLVNDQQIEDIINIVEENIEIQDCHNPNCEAYAIVDSNRDNTKKFIREILENQYWKAENQKLEQAKENYYNKKYEEKPYTDDELLLMGCD